MNKPYIILHMVSSVNGKITGDFLSNEKAQLICQDYYRIHREFNADGFICGRITMQGSFTGDKSPELEKFKGVKVKRCDRVAKKADFYAISIDPHARLCWYGSEISDYDPGYDKSHIIEVLTDMASDEYIAFLDSLGISYIFCGENEIAPSLLCQKLYSLFDIKTVLLEGGGLTDSLFMTKNLIDEISLVVAPFVEDSESAIDLFSKNSGQSVVFPQVNVERLANGGLWLRYKK